MNEKELVRRIIDFAFIIKSQLNSDETALLRSIMNILIMEAEDVVQDLEEKYDNNEVSDTGKQIG
ncbi:hypothetical protein MCEMSEM23_00534 [Rhabdaerophilaceae bacterium]